jgi:hypothetical protein
VPRPSTFAFLLRGPVLRQQAPYSFCLVYYGLRDGEIRCLAEDVA